MEGLTTDRLDWSTYVRHNLENYRRTRTCGSLQTVLMPPQQRFLKRLQGVIEPQPPQNFQADSAAVIETRFFRHSRGQLGPV